MIEQTIDILSRIVVKQHLIREVFFKVSLSPTHLTACIGWTGIVREDYLQTMFDQFATAHTGFAFTDHALGLYLCWKMIQLQGGELRLTINDQFKHQITFTLPYNAAQQGVAADAA
jgi:signal transduction histidine kinase